MRVSYVITSYASKDVITIFNFHSFLKYCYINYLQIYINLQTHMLKKKFFLLCVSFLVVLLPKKSIHHHLILLITFTMVCMYVCVCPQWSSRILFVMLKPCRYPNALSLWHVAKRQCMALAFTPWWPDCKWENGLSKID